MCRVFLRGVRWNTLFVAILVALAASDADVRASGLAADSVPATPLVVCDPYFSIWSTGKLLTDIDTTHWTGKPHRLVSLARVDGKCYRLMGAEPQKLPALEQTSSLITPTQTKYTFHGSGVELSLTFTTPIRLEGSSHKLDRFQVVIRDDQPARCGIGLCNIARHHNCSRKFVGALGNSRLILGQRVSRFESATQHLRRRNRKLGRPFGWNGQIEVSPVDA